MIFQPEHAEDISYVYVVNQMPESVSDFFVKHVSKRIGPLPMAFFVCVYSSCSVDKKIVHCCFSIDKKKLKMCRALQCLDRLLETYLIFFFGLIQKHTVLIS